MSLDPLQKLWQSQQLDIPVEQIMQQAKEKQRRMFWFMALDLLSWLVIVVVCCWHIHSKNTTENFILGLFTIILTSLFVGYILWIRTATWGMDSLDVRNTLKLSIRRCEAGIQMGVMCIVCCIIIDIGLVLFHYIYPDYFKTKQLFTFGWAFGWTIAFYIGYRWYSKRQKQKIVHFQSLLKQLEEDN